MGQRAVEHRTGLLCCSPSRWVCRRRRCLASAEKVKSLLGLPAHVRVTALVSIGYAAEEGSRPHRLTSESLVDFRKTLVASEPTLT